MTKIPSIYKAHYKGTLNFENKRYLLNRCCHNLLSEYRNDVTIYDNGRRTTSEPPSRREMTALFLLIF